MISKLNNQLLKAKDHYDACQLVEAYHIFRRYFDRIPFRFEREHAEYIGMFVRTLSELGKTHELHFYLSELERHYQNSKNSIIAYPLAVVYRSLPDPRHEMARQLFEEIIRNPNAGEYRTKAKMMLAHYYDWKKNDVGACRELIFSIEEPADLSLRILWEIWRAKIFRDEGKLEESEVLLHKTLESLSPQSDWYAYFTAKIVLAINYLKKGDTKKADEITAEVRGLFEGRHFKSLKVQIDELERQIAEKSNIGVIKYLVGAEKSEFVYQNHSLHLKKSSTTQKLLLFFIKKRFLEKQTIAKILYERQYKGIEDDKRIYYHIHTLRKRLKSIGVPECAIMSEKNGYRLIPKVEIVGGELWA